MNKEKIRHEKNMSLLRCAASRRSFILPSLCKKHKFPGSFYPPHSILNKKFLFFLFLLCLAAVLSLGFHHYTAPQFFSGAAEVLYEDTDETYQLILNNSLDRYQPIKEVHHTAGDQESYRFPVRMYANHLVTGEDASEEFLSKVESVNVQAESSSEGTFPIQCTVPEKGIEAGYSGVTLVSFINFSRESPSPSQIIWTFSMKNGDTIQLSMDMTITPTPIYNFDSANADLSDSAALQALIDQLAEQTSKQDIVNITLPAVTYTEPVILHDRAFNLTGTEEQGKRTTFADGIQIRAQNGSRDWISYFTDIDFIGSGSGMGVSSANRLWLTGCRFLNWDTAVLAYGEAWVNVIGCEFDGNRTGLHYNTRDTSPSDSHFTDNQFKENETAVLLESVSVELEMNFSGCQFEHNGTDIDNRCGQPLKLS